MSIQQEPPDGDDYADGPSAEEIADDSPIGPINAGKGKGLWGRIASALGLSDESED